MLEKEVLIREIHHRVKNNLQLMSDLLDMTRMRSGDELTKSILTDMMLESRQWHRFIRSYCKSRQFGSIDLASQIQDQASGLSDIYSHDGHKIRCVVNADRVSVPVDLAIPCALVLNGILSTHTSMPSKAGPRERLRFLL